MAADPALLDRARSVLSDHPIVDGHNDLAWAMRKKAGYDFGKVDIARPQPDLHTDIPRLRAGHVGAQFWSVFVPARLGGDTAVSATFEQIDAVHEMVRRYPDQFMLATTADEVERARETGRIGSLLGAEGGHSINESLATLRAMYALGVRYMTLTHNSTLSWADAATDAPRSGGLSAFGREVVREMNRLGMLVDCSHVAASTMRDALSVTEAPLIFSHSSARAICDHPRNVPDDVLAALAGNGGVCMVTFVPSFVSQEHAGWSSVARREAKAAGYDDEDPDSLREFLREYRATAPEPPVDLAVVADHVEHVREVAGVDHVGLGGDYDGVPSLPAGLEDVSCYPNLVAELLRRGWSPADLAKLTGGNILRVLRDAEATARTLRATRPPSLAVNGELAL